jgi:EH domain-containing protein 1
LYRYTEVCKVYVGSFNDKPPSTENNQLGAELFAKEQADLMKDLLDVPQRSCDRKVGLYKLNSAKTHIA